MELSALTAVSPLDGRYGRQTEALRDIFSEFAFMRARVTVEVEWLIALAEFNLPELKDLSEEDKLYLRGLVSSFSVEDCKAIKSIEATTNHDVKAVEYWIKSKMGNQRTSRSRKRVRSFRLHFRRHQQHVSRFNALRRTRAALLPPADHHQ